VGQGSKRNQLCSCGSRKKYKNCCGEVKPRNVSLTVDMGEPVAINGLQMSREGQIKFLVDGNERVPTYANLILAHERKNKEPKQTVRLKQNNNNLSLNLVQILFDNNFLYIIDTNTTKENIDGYYFSVTIVLEYQIEKKIELLMTNSWMRSFKHKDRHIGEKIGWIELIKMIVNDHSEQKISIVTDHDLGNIDKYNSRELPLIENTHLFLPPNIKLVYASADKKNDSIVNQLISICDKEASKKLNELVKVVGLGGL